jgi:hypothetical protein
MFKAIFLIAVHVFLFIGVMSLAQYWSGWGVLSKYYGLRRKFGATQRWTFLSAWMGAREANSLLGVGKPLFSLRSCLNIAVDEVGMRLSLFPMFRLFHPPLFIPWDHVSTKSCTGILSEWVEFRFREAPSVVLRLKKSVGNDIASFAPYRTLADES